jgi:hypothetical protein
MIEARDGRRVATLDGPLDRGPVEITGPAPGPAGLPPGYSSEESIRDAAWMVRPIALADLVDSAELLTRVDRKYFVPAATFRTLIAELEPLHVLEIDGQRTFDY